MRKLEGCQRFVAGIESRESLPTQGVHEPFAAGLTGLDCDLVAGLHVCAGAKLVIFVTFLAAGRML